MRDRKRSFGLRVALGILTAVPFITGSSSASEKKLHNFGNGTDGSAPQAGLIFDGAGNLYGTSADGGNHNLGTVFELTPNGSGGWTEKKLHNFGIGTDGTYPLGGLIFDTAGNLYGTTYSGGDYGGGTVFELTPTEGGGWTEKKLRNFGNGTDGAYPYSGLIFDKNGNLYGTTAGGGNYHDGTVFELTPTEGGGWTEKRLHNFGNGTDGAAPAASLIFDTAGNLYGTTYYGGDYPCTLGFQAGCGTVFELTPTEDGAWTEKKLHNFNYNAKDGYYPGTGLIFDGLGNLYGTTEYGGDNPCGNAGCGTVFELMPTEGGGWAEKKLHNFKLNGTDGIFPEASLIFDAAGNLYGTTGYGGDNQCNGSGCGTVFELTPDDGGGWTEKKLHNFGNGTDGIEPLAGLIFDAAGNLYGTTDVGGSYSCGHGYGCGTVFEITP